jgi:hypothetical protein
VTHEDLVYDRRVRLIEHAAPSDTINTLDIFKAWDAFVGDRGRLRARRDLAWLVGIDHVPVPGRGGRAFAGCARRGFGGRPAHD